MLRNATKVNNSKHVTDTIDEIGFGVENVPASAAILKAVEIGKGVTGLGEYCFCGCKKLESVTIPATVKRIGGTSTFQDCTSLKSIEFMGDSTWTPAICTFKGLTAITKTDLSPVTSLTALGKDAIRNCSELTELDIRNITEFAGIGTIVNCAALRLRRLRFPRTSLPRHSKRLRSRTFRP